MTNKSSLSDLVICSALSRKKTTLFVMFCIAEINILKRTNGRYGGGCLVEKASAPHQGTLLIESFLEQRSGNDYSIQVVIAIWVNGYCISAKIVVSVC